MQKDNQTTFLITGASGFIGANLCQRLLQNSNHTIIGIDNLNNYYDVNLKKYRLNKLQQYPNFSFFQTDITNRKSLHQIFSQFNPPYVINLAAQAGVRYSLENPDSYIDNNITGFYNVLEACKKFPVKHLVYASSSSVYGDTNTIPYKTTDKTDSPVSLYAATKKTNEILAYTYSKLFNIPTTGLRFFTVYGPAGRPDMAYFNFTKKLINQETIKIFNYGNCKRDFTYIDDIIEGTARVILRPPVSTKNNPPYKLYNIGHGNPVSLLDFIQILQEELLAVGILNADYDFDAHKEFVSMQPGDVAITYADTSALEKDFGYKPETDLRTGLHYFAKWYKNYYGGSK